MQVHNFIKIGISWKSCCGAGFKKAKLPMRCGNAKTLYSALARLYRCSKAASISIQYRACSVWCHSTFSPRIFCDGMLVNSAPTAAVFTFPSPFPKSAVARAYHSTSRNQTKFTLVAPSRATARPELVHRSATSIFFAKIQLPNGIFPVNLTIL